MKRAGTIALLMALPLTTWAAPVWKGDFESGDLTQWTGREAVASDRLQIVADPVREGRYALKVTVRKGDDPINASGNRNELFHFGNENEGTEYFYKWSTMFAPDYPSANTWQLFTQWHHDGNNGSPPLEFFVRGENIFLRLEGRDDRIVWSAPLERGRWLDFVLHVKWSSNPKVGFVELYYNGEQVLPKEASATLYPGMQNYLKQGLYRDESVGPVGVVYHDGMVQATALEDVMPPEPVATPEPTPAPVQDAPAETAPPAEPAPAPEPVTPPDSSPIAMPEVPAPDTAQPLQPGSQPLGSITAQAPGAPKSASGCSTAGESLAGLGLPTLFTVLGRVAFRSRGSRRT